MFHVEPLSFARNSFGEGWLLVTIHVVTNFFFSARNLKATVKMTEQSKFVDEEMTTDVEDFFLFS